MRRFRVLVFSLILAVGVDAQPNGPQQKFSPEKFDMELHTFITEEAKLTPQEAAKFFPVYKEMQAKQRTLYKRQRSMERACPQDEAACL